MNLRAFVPFAFSMLVASAAFADDVAPQTSVVVYVQGTVKVQRQGGEAVMAALGTEVKESDTVVTEDGAQVRIRLYDRSLIRLGPNSKAEMAQLRASTSAEKKTISVKLVVGRLWASVSKLLTSDSTFEVQAQSAVAGVRGTNFAVLLSAPDADAEFQVGEGSVNVRAGGENRLIGAGKAAIVGLNGFRSVRDLGVSQTALLLNDARGGGGGGGGGALGDRGAEGGKGIGHKVQLAAERARERMQQENRNNQRNGPGNQNGPGGQKPRIGGAQDVAEQRQRGKDVFEKLNDRAGATRLKAIIEVRE